MYIKYNDLCRGWRCTSIYRSHDVDLENEARQLHVAAKATAGSFSFAKPKPYTKFIGDLEILSPAYNQILSTIKEN